MRDTQNERLIAYLKKHHFITRRTAAVELGIMNLWQRCSEIEDMGYKLDRRRVKTRGGAYVLQYWLRSVVARRKAA